APGVRSALKASATLRFLPLLCWIFRPVPNRIRTTIMVTTVPVFCDTVLVRLQPVRNTDLTMKKLKTAVFGTGFMGRVHTEGIRRLGHVEVAASSNEKARKFGDEVGIARIHRHSLWRRRHPGTSHGTHAARHAAAAAGDRRRPGARGRLEAYTWSDCIGSRGIGNCL